MRRVAVMVASAEDDPETRPRLAAFGGALRELGWTEGRNIEIVYRYGAGNPELMRRQAIELAALRPELMVVQSNLALDAMRREGIVLPAVFLAVSDPVGSGYVSSLSRPGGQLTGFTNFEPVTGAKWLQLLKELAPAVTRVTMLLNPKIAANRELARAVESAAPALGVVASQEGAADAGGKEQAIAEAGRDRNGGLIVMPNPTNTEHRKTIVAACARHRVPAIYPFGYFARDGGLVSYGLDVVEMFKSTAGYVDRILKGAQPGELAVQQPTRYELVINLKAAQALGLRPSITSSSVILQTRVR
jgi:putative ABC transport system substrate-binding protein